MAKASAPQLLLDIKKSVDEYRSSDRFLLTGSANLMALPTVADSLAGRMETLSLLLLPQSETALCQANWIDQAFAGRILQVSTPAVGESLVERVLRGSYPEAVARRRTTWARQYIDALIERDVRDIAHIDKLDQLPHFFRALAHTVGQMCVTVLAVGQLTAVWVQPGPPLASLRRPCAARCGATIHPSQQHTQRKNTMSLPQAIAAGAAGDKLSRAITGTDQVSAGRSAIATGAGAALGATGVGALSVGAGAVGATALAAAVAPVAIPVAIVAGGIGFLCSLFE